MTQKLCIFHKKYALLNIRVICDFFDRVNDNYRFGKTPCAIVYILSEKCTKKDGIYVAKYEKGESNSLVNKCLKLPVST